LNFSKKTIISIILILVIINIGPASAMPIGEINNKVTNDLDRYNNYGFWGKLWHFGEICSSLYDSYHEYQSEIGNLKSQGESAINEAEKKKQEMNELNSEIENLKSEREKENKQSENDIIEAQKAIQHNKNIKNKSSKPTIINSPKILNKTNSTNKTINGTNNTNKTVNGTNNTNGTNKTINGTNNTNNTIIISDPARKNADTYPKKYFEDHKINYTELITTTQDLKKGYIVQLLKGNVFKYWMYQKYNNTTGMVSLITGNGNTVDIPWEKFINSYTGLAYQINNQTNNTQFNTSDAIAEIQTTQIETEIGSMDTVFKIMEKLDSYTETYGDLAKLYGIQSGVFIAAFALLFVIVTILDILLILLLAFESPLAVPIFLMSIIGAFGIIICSYMGIASGVIALNFLGFYLLHKTVIHNIAEDLKNKRDTIENDYKSEDL
jgi:hypothetical protein